MIVVVSGSRGWTDKEVIRKALLKHKPELVWEGGALGADRLAREVCQEELIPYKTERAKWSQYGKAAGVIRNAVMLDYKPDLLLAFWDGASPGTQGMINEASRRGITMEVYLGDF